MQYGNRLSLSNSRELWTGFRWTKLTYLIFINTTGIFLHKHWNVPKAVNIHNFDHSPVYNVKSVRSLPTQPCINWTPNCDESILSSSHGIWCLSDVKGPNCLTEQFGHSTSEILLYFIICHVRFPAYIPYYRSPPFSRRAILSQPVQLYKLDLTWVSTIN